MKTARVIILIVSILIFTASLVLIATNGWFWDENRGNYLVLISVTFTALSILIGFIKNRKDTKTLNI
jgi:hypothetical protein